jgi:TPR repeat protein
MIKTAATLELTPSKWPLIQKMALQGVANAQYLMGIAYLIGGVVDTDRKKAFYWFSLAAKQRHADAAFRCGYLISVNSETTKGRPNEWYAMAAEYGSAAGMVAIGNLWTFSKMERPGWLERIISRQDHSNDALEAFAWYVKASLMEYSTAYYFIGMHYLKGWGVSKCVEKACTYLKLGMEASDSDCAYLLAEVKGRLHEEFWDYCERAADLGHSHAQYRLGSFLWKKTHSVDQGITWLRRSAMQRHSGAMLAMSNAYENGIGVIPDLVSAYVWAKRAGVAGASTKARMARLNEKMDDTQKKFISSDTAENEDIEFFRLSQALFGKEYAPGML